VIGLHRLDDSDDQRGIVQMIAPSKSWVELEEQRRTFWGAFCIDSHASINTGWPTLIDYKEVRHTQLGKLLRRLMGHIDYDASTQLRGSF
jgi:hypothetical protein